MINLLFLVTALAACDINSEPKFAFVAETEIDFKFNAAKTVDEYLIAYPDQLCAIERMTDVERACFERYKLRWMGASLPFKVNSSGHLKWYQWTEGDTPDGGGYLSFPYNTELGRLKFENFAQYDWCVQGINADDPNRG